MNYRSSVLNAMVVCSIVIGGSCQSLRASDPSPEKLSITPTTVELAGPRSKARLLITGLYADNAAIDLTRKIKYESLSPHVVTISESGVLVPRGNGRTEIRVRFGNLEALSTVVVRDFDKPHSIDFRTEVIGALSRGGCNQGACHGSPQGKNGFRLSLRGYLPDLDFMTLTRQNFGRRTNPEHPASSLFLRKAIGEIPHQGGRRFSKNDPAHTILLNWVAEGSRDSNQPLELIPPSL